MYLSIFRQPTVVLSSFAAVWELLDTHGVVYSDRPTAVMAG